MGALYYRSKGDIIIDNVFVEVEFAQDVIYQSGGLIGFAYEGSVEISNSIVSVLFILSKIFPFFPAFRIQLSLIYTFRLAVCFCVI